MHDHIRFAALRAASKLALGVTFLGCGGATADGEPAAHGASGPTATDGADEYDLASPAAPPGRDLSETEAAAKARTCRDGGAPEAPSCKALIASTFSDPAWDDFRLPTLGEPRALPPVDDRVRDCCLEALEAPFEESLEVLGRYRWECCSLLGNGSFSGTPMACTPWGPPVPPAMTRGRRVMGVA